MENKFVIIRTSSPPIKRTTNSKEESIEGKFPFRIEVFGTEEQARTVVNAMNHMALRFDAYKIQETE